MSAWVCAVEVKSVWVSVMGPRFLGPPGPAQLIVLNEVLPWNLQQTQHTSAGSLRGFWMKPCQLHCDSPMAEKPVHMADVTNGARP